MCAEPMGEILIFIFGPFPVKIPELVSEPMDISAFLRLVSSSFSFIRQPNTDCTLLMLYGRVSIAVTFFLSSYNTAAKSQYVNLLFSR